MQYHFFILPVNKIVHYQSHTILHLVLFTFKNITSIMSIKKSSSNYLCSYGLCLCKCIATRRKRKCLEPLPPPTKSTLDDPQRQCIIEFVDNMSTHSEQPQHHIANISYQQHPSPPQAGEQSSASPTMKLKGTQ